MKVIVAVVLSLAVFAAAKSVPSGVHHEENHVEHHEEKLPENVVDHDESDITKRYTKDETYGPNKFYKYHDYDPETSSVNYGKHIKVGGKDIRIDYSRNDGGFTKTVKFTSDYPYHGRDYYYQYPEHYVDYKQQYSPYDFSGKVHSKFDKLHQYGKYGDVDEKTHKIKKSAEEEVEHHDVKVEHEDEHHTDINNHDVTVNKRSSFDYYPEYLRYDIGRTYPQVYGHGYPSYHGVGVNQYYGRYPEYQQYYPYHSTPYYNKGYPSYYHNTPYSYDNLYTHYGSEDIETRVRELKDWLKKYDEIKVLSKKYNKRESVDEVEHVSEHHVPEHHVTQEHHVNPSYHGVPHYEMY